VGTGTRKELRTGVRKGSNPDLYPSGRRKLRKWGHTSNQQSLSWESEPVWATAKPFGVKRSCARKPGSGESRGKKKYGGGAYDERRGVIRETRGSTAAVGKVDRRVEQMPIYFPGQRKFCADGI